MLAPGARLGPYEVIAPLGSGGMGEVYRARDTRLDRTVAVKVLPEAFSGDAALRQRLHTEARAISQLSHPHICTLYDRRGVRGRRGVRLQPDVVAASGFVVASGFSRTLSWRPASRRGVRL
jgi:hypothetical protein